MFTDDNRVKSHRINRKMDYTLSELIDIPLLQNLLEKLNVISSFPFAIMDNDGNVLTAVAWQDICTKFHRIHPECKNECIKSDRYIYEHINEANPAVSYQCPHGLIDNAVPIIVDGKYLGNFFTGQIFLEKPDLEYFKKQAEFYGFDEKEYMEAVEKVPIWTKEKLIQHLDFFKGFIDIITGIGLNQLREKEAYKFIKESEEQHRTILQTAMDGFVVTDLQGGLTEVNETYCLMSGYSEAELLTMNISDLEVSEDAEAIASRIQKIYAHGEDRFETFHRRKNGIVYDVEVSAKYKPDGGGRCVAFLRDITGRKKAKETLLQTQILLNSSIESQKDTILFSIDHHYRYLYFNKAHSDAMKFGYKQDISLEMNILDCITSDEDRIAAKENFDRALRGESHSNIRVFGDFQHACYESFFNPVVNEHNEIIGATGLARNISDRKNAEEVLKLSETRYKKAQQVGHIGSWEYDLKNGTFWGSDEGKRIYGFDVASDIFTAEEVMECVVGRDRVNQALVDLIEKNKPYNIVFDVIQHNSNETRTINSIAELVMNEQGIPVKVTGVLLDITERIRGEELLKESEEKFRTMSDQSVDLIALTDANGMITYASSSSRALFHYEPEELCGRNFTYFLHESSVSKAVAAFRLTIGSGESVKNIELTMKRKDGSLFDGELSGSVFQSSSQKGTLVTIHDITEHRLAEKTIKESEALYRNLVEQSLDGVYKSTHAGKFVEVNPAMVKMLGYSSKEELMAIDIKTQLYFSPDERESLISDEMQGKSGVYPLRKKDGSEIWVEDHGWYNYDENGNILFHEGILRDVTTRKQVEDEIRMFNETLENRIAERTAQLEASNKELAVHMDEVEQFTYIASHDLQEPLRTLTNFTQLIMEDYSGKLDEDGNKYIGFINKAAGRMRELVTGLVEYSVLGKESVLAIADCNKIVREVLSDINDSINESKAKITVMELPTIKCYETELRLMFQNLIVNAIKFKKKDVLPEINISAEKKDKGWLFSIQDNGIGIDDKNKEKIFIIFKRMHNRSDYKGTGIGLAHCKKIAELHGGKIWVESTLDSGSVFQFTIPV